MICLLLFACSLVLAATPTQNTADIAVIDRAIASAQPGQERVRFGDVGMRVADLKIFRDRLAGTTAVARPDGNPEPLSDTPNGTVFKWPGGSVNFRFDPTQVSNSTLTADKMRQVRDAVAEWAAFANLTFNEFSGTPPANYITVQEKADGSEGGFSSSVGMAGGEQFVQIGTHSWNRGTVCHEVGHAIGLFHEQQRDDRDTFVIINFGNMDPGNQPNFAKLPGGSTSHGAYDFYSVMHYSRNALSNNGGDTISMQPAFAQFINVIGNVNDRTLSKLDRSGMAAVYGNPGTLPSAVVTNTKDSGPGSLRAALYYAFDKSTDAPPVPTTVIFHIPMSDPNFANGVFTIQPSYIMTAPGDGTTVDGTTQTTFTGDTNTSGPEIVLDGSIQLHYETIGGVFGPGFILRQANCTVKGFVIQGYDQDGIQIANNANLLSVATGNVVSGCYLGTDKAGSTGVPNTFPGVEIYSGANHNTIGGTTLSARNVISGNAHYGIYIHDAGSSNNLIEGNYIGVNAAGTGALSNAFAGVAIRNGAQSNTIGGTAANARNIISGNKAEGVQIGDSGTNANIVLGNYIGTDFTGTAALPNGLFDPPNHNYAAGISLFGGAQNNVIGGSAAGSANVISANAAGAVSIGGVGTNGNVILGNRIGTNAAGTSAIGNGVIDPGYAFSGISIFDGPQFNTIGGTAAGAANIVSGNNGPGILISGVGANANSVQGNLIGLTAAGNAALANQYYGIGIFGNAMSNTVGGTVAGARNVISGNGFDGVAIGGTGTNQNVVLGNYLGVDATGTSAIGNGSPGVSIFGEAQFNIVGGTTAAARNVISGNTSQDVFIGNLNTTNNVVQGNYIGLNAAGTVAISNNNDGIGIFGNAQNNTIGGTAPGARNFISGHMGAGVALGNIGTNGNFVQGNTIGLNALGSPVPNTGPGVSIFDSAQSNFVGGTAMGASNIISGNSNEGVAVFSFNSTTIQEAISRNSIFGNGGAGIALYNGGNNSQAFPTLTAATLSTVTNPNGTDVAGSLTAAANTTYTIEFFASSTGDPSGFGEGQFFVGSASLLTNGAGSVNFTTSLAAAVPAGYVVAATATDPLGNTSQFSATHTVLTTDSDGDGIPDAWMNARFGHNLGQAGDKSRASDDADGDGLTNLQEFRAGTDPKSAASVLRISGVDKVGTAVRVSFPTVTGKTYRLESRDDLVSGSWNVLTDQVFGTGSTLQITDPSAAGLAKRFYRVVVEP
jgi:hypothetical protein